MVLARVRKQDHETSPASEHTRELLEDVAKWIGLEAYYDKATDNGEFPDDSIDDFYVYECRDNPERIIRLLGNKARELGVPFDPDGWRFR